MFTGKFAYVRHQEDTVRYVHKRPEKYTWKFNDQYIPEYERKLALTDFVWKIIPLRVLRRYYSEKNETEESCSTFRCFWHYYQETVKCFRLIIYPNQQLRNQPYSKRECSYLNRQIKLTKRCETRSKELRRRSAPTPVVQRQGAAALIILGYK